MSCTGALELDLVARGLGLGMRCGATSLRSKLVALVGKLLRRLLTAAHATLHRLQAQGGAPADQGRGAPPPDPAERAADLAGAQPAHSRNAGSPAVAS